MNKPLALSMENGINAARWEKRKGFCLRACRQSAEPVHGLKYDALFRGGQNAKTQDERERDATAARAGHRFVAAGLGFFASELQAYGGLQAGDMLVKTEVARNRWGDYSGHIGTLMLDLKRVGENSSTSRGRVHGALGFRTLDEFGDFNIVIRIPPPHVIVPKIAAKLPPVESPVGSPGAVRELALFDGDKVRVVEGAVLVRDKNMASVTATLAALGLDYQPDGVKSTPARLVLRVWEKSG